VSEEKEKMPQNTIIEDGSTEVVFLSGNTSLRSFHPLSNKFFESISIIVISI